MKPMISFYLGEYNWGYSAEQTVNKIIGTYSQHLAKNLFFVSTTGKNMLFYNRDKIKIIIIPAVIRMIKSSSFLYENSNQLKEYIYENHLEKYSNILVQVFSGTNQKPALEETVKSLNRLLPQATVIGTTTSGEIIGRKFSEHQIALNFTTFEKTELTSFFVEFEGQKDWFRSGQDVGEKLISNNTKGILLFQAGDEIDTEQFLNGLHEAGKDIVVAGAIAGDQNTFAGGFVITNEKIAESGIAGVAFNNEELEAAIYTNHPWEGFGKSFTITKCDGKVVYSIDHKNPAEILHDYLGHDYIERLPFSGAEFPFLLETKGGIVSVYATKVLDEGAIQLNLPVKEGSRLSIGYANMEQAVNESMHYINQLNDDGAEALFVYNNMSRKYLLGDFVEKEMEALKSIAPANGFYSFGEIFSKGKKNSFITGHSLTIMALSETKGNREKRDIHFEYEIPRHSRPIKTLLHLLKGSDQSLQELCERTKMSEQYYRSLFDNNTDIVYSTDVNGMLTSVNPAFEKLVGIKKDKLIKTSSFHYVSENDLEKARKYFHLTLQGSEHDYTIEIDAKSGKRLLFQMKNIPITVNGKIVGVYGIGRNITEEKKFEEKINRLAFYDQQTGLPNRIRFTEMLNDLLHRVKKEKSLLPVLSIDMDRFKIVNDSFGHQVGDMVLKEISERIKHALPDDSLLGRFSGDKFNAVITKNVSVDRVVAISQSILQSISAPLKYSGKEFFVTASIGISFFPNDGSDAITLLKNADVAMNRSKYPGGNRVTLYSVEMNDEALQRLELESYLRKALAKDEFFLCYQPLIDLATGNLYGSEALIRWQHPKYGLVNPGDFIPLAEETGLIEDIGRWVLRTACKQNRKWQMAGKEHLTVSVNVSANQFQQKSFVDDVKWALRDSGLAPEYLMLELTESTMLRNIDHSIAIMSELKELGVKVSIDDFGTGYSSFSYLKNLPIHTLKIDRSFINNLKQGASDIAIVKAIITMGHGLSVKVVAEGVETKEQIELLKDLNCHYAQGFYINKPLPVEEFEKRLFA